MSEQATVAEVGQPAVADLTRKIRDAITEGRFAPNQRLIEPDLCAMYGATRAAIRLALFELTGEGLVERTLNRGAKVRAISLDEAVEILETRSRLEALCAAKAAELISDAERDEFIELKSALGAAVSSLDLLEYSRLNQLLDRRIREISRHTIAIELLDRLNAQVVRQQFLVGYLPSRATESVKEHGAIIDAIVGRDPAAADAATRSHLESLIAALRLATSER